MDVKSDYKVQKTVKNKLLKNWMHYDKYNISLIVINKEEEAAINNVRWLRHSDSEVLLCNYRVK